MVHFILSLGAAPTTVLLLELLELGWHGVRYLKVILRMLLLCPYLLGFRDVSSHLHTICVRELIGEKLARPAQIVSDVRIHLLLQAQLHYSHVLIFDGEHEWGHPANRPTLKQVLLALLFMICDQIYEVLFVSIGAGIVERASIYRVAQL